MNRAVQSAPFPAVLWLRCRNDSISPTLSRVAEVMLTHKPMKCPGCSADCPLTWRHYVTMRFPCPACGAALRRQHHRWYWPLMLLGCCAFGVPAAFIVGSYFGSWAGIGGWLVGGAISGIPFDKFLESRYSILHVQEGAAANSPSRSGCSCASRGSAR